ncbi:Immunoglobulin-binding protein 1 [Merluccius polli]|nr:Immunoglobulin-binding protein 1 [Merluccius polli]
MADSGSTCQTVDTDAKPYKLSELFNCGWKIFEEVDTTNEAIGSNSVQVKIKRGIKALEDVTRMVDELQLFSSNELLEEMATTDMKYLLLPALLGGLTMKLTNRDSRLKIVNMAREYFHDFLRRCKEYHVSDFRLPKSLTDEESISSSATTKSTASTSSSDLVAMAVQRQAKIERYRQKKMTEDRLVEVKKAVDSETADEEVVRDFYLLNVKKWINIALEEIDSIDQELEILKGMDIPAGPPQCKHPSRPPMKPFVLTKDAIQAQVFGAGYPSLATMTVDDWYEQHQKRGVLPDQGVPKRVAVEENVDAKDHEDEMKEKQVENDDEEAMVKARNWDDWKDSHRRGYGNRKNMG